MVGIEKIGWLQRFQYALVCLACRQIAHHGNDKVHRYGKHDKANEEIDGVAFEPVFYAYGLAERFGLVF